MLLSQTTLLITLVVFVLGQSSSVCDKIKEDGLRLTTKKAQDVVGPWAQGQFNEWKGLNSSGQVSQTFWSWLHHKWASDAANSITSCDLSSLCSPVSCRLIDQRGSIEDQVNAFYTLESIANFHNMAYEIRKAHMEAWNSAKDDLSSLVDKFTDARNIEKHRKKHDLHWKIASHTVITFALLISAIGTVLTAGASSLSLLGLVTVSEESIKLVGAYSGLAGTASVAAISYGSDFMHGHEYASKIVTELSSSQKKNQDLVTDGFDKSMQALFSGSHGSGKSTLVDLVASGRYVETKPVLKPSMNKILRQIWTASYISNLWNTESTYIVMALAKGGCEGDKRGFGGLRICLEEAPKYVFYIFFKSRIREGQNHKALIRGPPGHKLLEEHTGFTLKDVVRSSYIYSKHNGYSIGSDEPLNMVDTFFSADAIGAGGEAHGMFNIPILYSPGGEAISSINSRKNRNYPCMAAALPWGKGADTSPADLGSRSPAGKGKGWTNNDPATMAQFLNATGLYQSGDWWSFCTGSRKRHGNHCRGNKAISWEGKFGKTQYKKLKHPFKRCKSRGHAFVGCDSPHDNGYQENKCNGKKTMPGVDGEQWVEEADYGVNATIGGEAGQDAADEAELSDWTDGEDEVETEESGFGGFAVLENGTSFDAELNPSAS